MFGPGILTPEALVGAAPDVIVVPESGFAALGGAEAFLEVPGVADTPAGHRLRDGIGPAEGIVFFGLCRERNV